MGGGGRVSYVLLGGSIYLELGSWEMRLSKLFMSQWLVGWGKLVLSAGDAWNVHCQFSAPGCSHIDL